VIGAKWDEVDLDAGQWVIPADRMKTNREHTVPLSKPAVKLLKNLPQIDNYLFPGQQSSKHISNMAMLKLLKRLGRDDLTVHGFRSSFRDWCAEQTNYPHEVAEMALAHTIKNKAEAAYRRGDLLEKRRKMMADWGGCPILC
jgi:integrase